MTAAVFRAHDAWERRRLLADLGNALDEGDAIASSSVLRFAGGDASLYLWSLWNTAFVLGEAKANVSWSRAMSTAPPLPARIPLNMTAAASAERAAARRRQRAGRKAARKGRKH